MTLSHRPFLGFIFLPLFFIHSIVSVFFLCISYSSSITPSYLKFTTLGVDLAVLRLPLLFLLSELNRPKASQTLNCIWITWGILLNAVFWFSRSWEEPEILHCNQLLLAAVGLLILKQSGISPRFSLPPSFLLSLLFLFLFLFSFSFFPSLSLSFYWSTVRHTNAS